jgi:chorismate-pyruvate lyase
MLKCNGQATVYARSIISDQAIRASKHQLTKLGNVPLGHLLFKQAKVNLETREVARIVINGKTYFARRTLYQLNREDILVTEFFLRPLW